MSGDSIAELLGAIKNFCAREVAAEERSEELIPLRYGMNLLEVEFSKGAAAFAATDLYERHGSITPIDWIRHHCRLSGPAAADRVCVGEQLERLPQSVEALNQDRLGFAHLALLARTSQVVAQSPTSSGFDETPLLLAAEETSVGRFQLICMQARHAADPERYVEDEAIAVESREFHLTNFEDGRVGIKGVLDSTGGAVLRTALEPLARKAGKDDIRHKDRRMGDALVELAGHGLDIGVIPQRASQRPHV
jgi:hypothetical protein